MSPFSGRSLGVGPSSQPQSASYPSLRPLTRPHPGNYLKFSASGRLHRNGQLLSFRDSKVGGFVEMDSLIDPQPTSSRNAESESWLILLCGSSPILGAVHIEIPSKIQRAGSRRKTTKKRVSPSTSTATTASGSSSQRVSDLLNAAKSLFRGKSSSKSMANKTAKPRSASSDDENQW